jgi:small subunit ribosomal protein S4e
MQLNLHDGRNIIVDGKYKTGDVVQLGIPEQSIKDTFSFEAGTLGLVIQGKHAGEISAIKSIELTSSSRSNVVHLKSFSTIKPYVFPVGKEEPLIKLPEVVLYE